MHKRSRLERVRGRLMTHRRHHHVTKRIDFYKTPIVSFYFESLMYFLFLIVYSSSVIFPLADWTGATRHYVFNLSHDDHRANGDPRCHLGLGLYLALYPHDRRGLYHHARPVTLIRCSITVSPIYRRGAGRVLVEHVE